MGDVGGAEWWEGRGGGFWGRCPPPKQGRLRGAFLAPPQPLALGEAGEATAPARLRVSLTCIEALWLTLLGGPLGAGPQAPAGIAGGKCPARPQAPQAGAVGARRVQRCIEALGG